MTNEEKIKAWCEYDSNNMDMYELIVANEREKMTDEQIADYLAYLSDKEKALVLLNYLLRGGITDDDLRGLRLQWIKDEREKMQQLPNDTGFMAWYEKYFKLLKEPKLWTSKARGQAYSTNDLIAMYNKAMQQNLKEIATGEREKMQGVEVYISWDSEDAEFEPQENPCSVWADRPEYDREFGTFNESIDVAWLFNVPEEFCDTLGVDSGQCKKFRIVEELL